MTTIPGKQFSGVVDGAEDALETGDLACATGAVPRVASNTRCGKPFRWTSGSVCRGGSG